MRSLLTILIALVMFAGCDLIPDAIPINFPPETQPIAEPVAEKLEVLDFYATWCGPCKLQAPRIAMLIQDGYDITKINVDKEEKLAHAYNIHEVPTYVVLVNGEEVYRTNQAWKLTDYLRQRDVRSIQTSQGPVRNVPEAARPSREGKSDTAAGTDSSADVRGEAERQVMEPCSLRDRHLRLNDRGVRPARNAR